MPKKPITLNSVTDEQMAAVCAVLAEIQPVRCAKFREALENRLRVPRDDSLQLVAAASYKNYADCEDGLWFVKDGAVEAIRDTITQGGSDEHRTRDAVPDPALG